MAAYFDIYADPPQADGRVSVHPRLVDPPAFSTDNLISQQTSATTLTRADIEASLSAFSDYLLRQLSMGGRVHLNRIGTFRVVPQFKEKKYEGDRITGKDVTFKRIVFTPTRELLMHLRHNLSFEHREGRHSNNINETQVVILLREYFNEHEYITLREFRKLTGTTDAHSRRMVAGLMNKNRLTRRRVGSAYLYEPNRYYFPAVSSSETDTYSGD